MVLASADVEILLAAVAVVAEVEDLVIGQDTHSPLGVGVVGDMDPQGRAALAGVAEVLLDGGGVIGDRSGDALGEAALDLEPLPAVQDLLTSRRVLVGHARGPDDLVVIHSRRPSVRRSRLVGRAVQMGWRRGAGPTAPPTGP